jgi:hypothetical protein
MTLKLTVKTAVDTSALEKWCAELPECSDFLNNFFCSCRSYDYDTNLENYLKDIDLQRKIDPNWNNYCRGLVYAFKEIAYRGEELN